MDNEKERTLEEIITEVSLIRPCTLADGQEIATQAINQIKKSYVKLDDVVKRIDECKTQERTISTNPEHNDRTISVNELKSALSKKRISVP